MKIVLSPNTNCKQKKIYSPNFKNRDYFLKIKELPDMTCGCCGKKVLRSDIFVNSINSLSKPLSYILSRGKLDYVQKAFPEAWKTLLKFSSRYPDLTLDKIIENQENYVKLKVNIADELDIPSLEENSKDRINLDRYIGKRFFDLSSKSRCMMKDSSTVIEQLLPLKSYLHDAKKEAFELLEQYSKIYPQKTLREIIETVHPYHEKRNLEFKQNKITEINQQFSNIGNIIKEKAPKLSKVIKSLEEKSWNILKTEQDPSCRKYKIKELYKEKLKNFGYKNVIPEVLQEIEKIPVSLVNADTFFAYAYHKNFSDGEILEAIFNPIIASEEHIVMVSDSGKDLIGNKTVLCKECNGLRKEPYSTFVKYHPETAENYQKQIDTITKNLIDGSLSENYRFYPYTVTQALKKDSNEKIDLDLIFYSQEMLTQSEEKLKILEEEIEKLTNKRDYLICSILKASPESKLTISEQINNANIEMQALRNKIWTERNLQTIINEYLKGKNIK